MGGGVSQGRELTLPLATEAGRLREGRCLANKQQTNLAPVYFLKAAV